MLGHEDIRQAERDKGTKADPFILTYTGRMFSYNCITLDCINIRDIAHSLSHLCRYTGHTKGFYSVAQHSLLVANRMPGGPADRLVGLLHDAAEAYTNDLASPLKRWLDEYEGAAAYGHLQDSITAAIYNKYGITSIPPDVRLYDQAACAFEAEGFMGLGYNKLKEYSFPAHLQGLWQPWEPHAFAEAHSNRHPPEVVGAFLWVFKDLMNQLGRKTDDN